MSWVLKDVTTNEERNIVLNGTENYEIGRRRNITNGLVCYSPVVSKNHATISLLPDGKLQVVDMESANGTFINNVKIRRNTPILLNHEDEIGFGVSRQNHKTYSKPYYLFILLKLPDSSLNIAERNDIPQKNKLDIQERNNTAKSRNCLNEEANKINSHPELNANKSDGSNKPAQSSPNINIGETSNISTMFKVEKDDVGTTRKREIQNSNIIPDNSVIEIIDLLDDEFTIVNKKPKILLNEPNKIVTVNLSSPPYIIDDELLVSEFMHPMVKDITSTVASTSIHAAVNSANIPSTSKNNQLKTENIPTSVELFILEDTIEDLDEIKDSCKLKEEVADLNYSMVEDLIVIDDDDVNLDFMYSQLFIKDEIETQEKINGHEDKEIIDIDFLDIKKEIADFDRINYIPSPVIIDSDSDNSLGWLDDVEKDQIDFEPNSVQPYDKRIKSEHIDEVVGKLLPVLPSDFNVNVNNIVEGIDIIHYNADDNTKNSDLDSVGLADDNSTSTRLTISPSNLQEISDSLNIADLKSVVPDPLIDIPVDVPVKTNKAPIIIEAQCMPQRTRSARVTSEKVAKENEKLRNKTERKKIAEKRVHEKKPEKAKRGKRKRSTDTMDRETKEQIQEARKKRLKELADKTAADKEEKHRATKCSKAHVKVSLPRGDFLLSKTRESASSTSTTKQIEQPSTSGVNTRSSQHNAHNSMAKTRIPKKIPSVSEDKPDINIERAVLYSPSSKLSFKTIDPTRASGVSTRSSHCNAVDKTRYPNISEAKTNINAENTVLRTTSSNDNLNSAHRTNVNKLQVWSSTVKSSYSEKLRDHNLNSRPLMESNRRHQPTTSTRHTDQSTSLITEHGDIILQLIVWNPKWCEEAQNANKAPPVTTRPCVRMCKSYANYNDYYEVLHSLIILDFWFSIANDFKVTQFNTTNNKDTFLASIINIQRTSTHIELICTSLLSKVQRESGQYLREKYFTLITVPIEGPKRTYKKMFGVVDWIDLRPLRPTDQMDEYMGYQCGLPETKLTYMIIVKTCNEGISMKQHVWGRYFPLLPQYLRLLTAVKTLEHSPLCPLILEPAENKYTMPYIPNKALKLKAKLNDIQSEAVLESTYFSKQKPAGIYLIEGPPGTGKTTTISNIILQILLHQPDARILLLAPSNGAIDSLINQFNQKYKSTLADCDKRKIKLVRIGKQEAMHCDVVLYSVDELARSNVNINFFKEHAPTIKDYETLTKELSALKEQLKVDNQNKEISAKLKNVKYKRDYFAKLYWNNNAKYNKKLREQKNLIMFGANLVCSTLGSVSKLKSYGFMQNRFTVCIIDEASQCSEAETMIPLILGVQKLILVGDPQQLPACTSSMLVKNFDYGKSLFSRMKHHLEKRQPNPIKMLTEQYRMHPEICKYPSHAFYNGQLKTGNIQKNAKGLSCLNPYIVFNQKVQKHSHNQYLNTNEVDIIGALVEAISLIVGRQKFSIGIITPYTVQRDAINTRLETIRYDRNDISITCNTVDSFQGQEKDVILLSCVRNSSNFFLSDAQRLNVAITRAKHALYIIGMESLFETCITLKKLKMDAVDRGVYLELSCQVCTSVVSTLIKKKS